MRKDLPTIQLVATLAMEFMKANGSQSTLAVREAIILIKNAEDALDEAMTTPIRPDNH